MLLFEVVITRLFSVLFFYHFSFFAISLVMSGLVIGGIIVSRWNARDLSEHSFATRLALLSAFFSAATGVGIVVLTSTIELDAVKALSLMDVAGYALLFLPGLVAAGAFLALAFARNQQWIGKLYAADLLAAAAACIVAIAALRLLEGPAVVVVVAGLASAATVFIAPRLSLRLVGGGMTAGAFALLWANSATDGTLLRLKTAGGPPMEERWNEHSRVRVFGDATQRALVIDRTAATFMRHLPPPIEVAPGWADGTQYVAYRTGRPVRSVAVIGVGAGGDLLPPLFYGAKQIDGYEINRTMIDFLQRDFREYNGVAARPEVHLIHDEGRVGIAHSGQRYDVIQASLIDTWAATASGGFVLSENSLYTREGWHVFLEHLTDSGILTMSRWHIPDAPAETHRLVALAAASLEDEGFRDTASHIVLLRSDRNDEPIAFGTGEVRSICTILVSKAPFTTEEVQRLRAYADQTGGEVMAAPNVVPNNPILSRLLASSTRASAIAESPFNIAPPTDLQPYFFLQVRPGDLVNLTRRNFGSITEITFNGVRVMMVLAACSLALVMVVGLLTVATLPGKTSSDSSRSVYRWMTVYFLGIGLGYILVQIGLLQRLIIVLGRPTFSLSVVLFSMLLGTGFGAACSERLFPTGNIRRCMFVILSVLVLLRLTLPGASVLEGMQYATIRVFIIGAALAATGFALGCAFPLGVRRVAPTGEWAIQKMWAMNGAASIAASVLAAVIGLAWGSAAVLTAGILAYALSLAASEKIGSYQ
jgi:hypothetical protein